MAIDQDKSFDVGENGVQVTDPDGNSLLYITGGTGSPIGIQAPVPSLYVDDSANVWKKVGALASDWEQIGNTVEVSIDGGFANSVFTPQQCFDGGGA